MKLKELVQSSSSRSGSYTLTKSQTIQVKMLKVMNVQYNSVCRASEKGYRGNIEPGPGPCRARIR